MKLSTHIVRAIVVVFVMMSTFSRQVFADESGGSGYSRYGIGDIRFFNSARSEAMGGAGLALLSLSSLDRVNPALWGKINRTRFSASTLYEGFSASDQNTSAYLGRMRFNGFMLAIPISPDNGVTFAGGFTPYSRVNYNIITQQTLGTENYSLQYEGNGGVSEGNVGLSYSPAHDIFIGTKLDYYFGTIEHVVRQTFTSSSLTSTEETRSLRVSGIGMTFGIVYNGLSQMFSLPAQQSLSIGGYVSTTSYVNTYEDLRQTYNSTSVVANDTTEFPDGTMRIPFSAGIGIAFQSERIGFATDFVYQQWSKFTLNGAATTDLRDSYRIGTGIELIPKRDQQAPFTQRLAYRFGLFYNSTYYDIKGQGINEFGVTGGIGAPVFFDSRINLAAEYSFRGTTDFQLQKDKIFRLSLTLNIGEHWFQHPEEE